jgi:hypothetical protein
MYIVKTRWQGGDESEVVSGRTKCLGGINGLKERVEAHQTSPSTPMFTLARCHTYWYWSLIYLALKRPPTFSLVDIFLGLLSLALFL